MRRGIVNGLLLSAFVYVLLAALTAAHHGHNVLALGLVVVETGLALVLGCRYEVEEVDPWEGQ